MIDFRWQEELYGAAGFLSKLMEVNIIQSKAVRACFYAACLAAGFVLAAVVLGGCSAERDGSRADRAITGSILEVDADAGRIRVEVTSGAEFLEERRVWASARRGDVANAEPGVKIRAFLADANGGGPAYRLEQVWPADETAERVVEHLNRRLREDTVLRGEGNYRMEGEALPRFALYDQSGNLVRPERFAGKRVVLNFIFTRCMDPVMCPAATQRMAQLQASAGEAGIEDFELVSVTLDPDYDTPGVLREYATDRGIDLGNFSFLTGPERAVRDMMTQLGVLSYPDDDMYFTHTMATLLVDRDGTIIHRVEGSQWMVSDFLERLKEAGNA